MKRWVHKEYKYAEVPAVDAFLADMWTVCERHGMALAHEDNEGGFIVVPLAIGDKNWLMYASYNESTNG